MDRAAQDRAIRPASAGPRKVVLATSIAESSLTIEGVRVVVDCGLARVPRFEPDLGLTRLETVRASRASADQRRGRAGRTEPGVCYRLWEEAATGALPPFARPEILDADLSGLVLDLALWGARDPPACAWLDPPPAPARGGSPQALLEAIGALDARRRDHGRGPRHRGAGGAARAWPAWWSRRPAAATATRRPRSPPCCVERGPRRQRGRSRPTGSTAGAAIVALAPRRRGAWPQLRPAGPRGSRRGRARSGRAAGDRPDPGARLSGADRQGARAHRASFCWPMAAPRRSHEAGALANHPSWRSANSPAGRRGAHSAGGAADPGRGRSRCGAAIASRDEVSFDPARAGLAARRVTRLGAIVLDEHPMPVPGDETSAAILARGLGEARARPPALEQGLAQWRDRVGFLRVLKAKLARPVRRAPARHHRGLARALPVGKTAWATCGRRLAAGPARPAGL